MSESDRDYELSVRALRGEASPHVDKARVRERLAARGILATAVASTVAVTATAQTGVGLSLASKLVTGAVVASLTVFSVAHFSRPTIKPLAPLDVSVTAEPARAVRAPGFTSYAAEKTDEHASEVKHVVRREPTALDLARENALLSAAVQALRAGDHASAKASLDQHEREFPKGFLRAERDKARARLGAVK